MKTYKKTSYKKTVEYGYPVEEDRPLPPLDYKEEISKGKTAMKMIILILIAAFVVFCFSGCTKYQPEPVVKYITRTEVQEVKVPVMPKIPELYCEFEGPGLDPTRNLLACLIYHKRVLEILRSGKINLKDPWIGDQIERILESDYPNDYSSKVGNILKLKQ